ncbi:amyloid beta A4 precursor protein-binding family B member 1-interacting protein-like [Pongo pygmaeus]|uniref:amyloid beta A4 precursor protein-binding family B member 1-interacting protein-like n=1 Tax=Pongo pygmaeus TaxID=9600 RepID=UPI0023E316D9|nr:amyloid beta A4 precursor protein-binding family B member 1-interacting protein-like [Pongo pygmaeus]XP_054292556.1 amyloid beta A4 precursor protein-binding family B member 1-interacting protein-like [Pongo pygmaeus]XP_054292557.1 amyloid beta A4 precursor protein-binding family B member 1-interacting protein-like [Pongo pygmaeus]XP_054292558.1 amyloid beta A4 precursor protein-binding family B member 1-interacting protein-like [Pongo pygmaeus]XP_054292559.1 amyloid beta A4 precursor protei
MRQALCQKDKLKGPINGTTQPNGQMPQAADSVSAVLEEAQAHAETYKYKKPALGNHQEPGASRPRRAPSSACPTPSGAEVLGHHLQPRHALQSQGHRGLGLPHPACRLPDAPAAAAATATVPGLPRAPAAAPDFMEAPQDFVPPPPAVAKRPPMPHPHKRHEA